MRVEEASTRPSLLRALGGGSADASWKVFVERYTPLVNTRCHAAGLQPADAEDVRQQVFAQLVRVLAEFEYDPARKFRGFLTTVVRNAIHTHWRTLQRRPGSVASGGGAMPEPLADLPTELDDGIRSGLDELTRVTEFVRFEVGPDAWAAFWLTAVEGLSGEEAAAQLRKRPSAVYMAKSRVLARLRAAIGPDFLGR
jgi:RNA polymerase sigma factor (sigma-70 family)